MLETYSSESQVFYEGGSRNLGLSHFLRILKRRGLAFIVSFAVVLLVGAFITAIQRPTYQAKGKILIDSQEIPTDLVKPTVADGANERIQAIEQRVLTRDNLLGFVKKYGMFGREQAWMSPTDLLDTMRASTTFELVDTSPPVTPGRLPSSTSNPTIAFTVSFDYQNPEITLRVTNDLLTLILNEDATNRTNRATETTRFLSQESERLQGQVVSLETQINEIKTRLAGEVASQPQSTDKTQANDLTKLKEELAEKGATYSENHPRMVALRKKIAAMEQLVANTSSQAIQNDKNDNGLLELQRREKEATKTLEEINEKLQAARLGEQMERNQQSERLRVIEQPILPQDPVKPNKIKFLAVVFALAMAAGGGAVIAKESLDTSIRDSSELNGVANGRLIVSIPYIATRSESSRRRGRLTMLAAIVGILLLTGLIGFLFFGPPIDLASSVNQLWLDHLTRLAK